MTCRGSRTIAADDFFTGLFATALRSDELLVAAEFDLPGPGDVDGFGELTRRTGDYAMIGLAAILAVLRSHFCPPHFSACAEVS